MMKSFVMAGLLSLLSFGALAQANDQEVSQLGKSVIVLKNEDDLQSLPYSIDRLTLQAVVRSENTIKEIIFTAKDFENYENCSLSHGDGSCDLYRCEADVRVAFGHFYAATVKTENIRNCKFVDYVRN